MQNLADLYSEQGRFAEAKPLYVEALALSRRVRGSDHPDTARLGMNLANWYRNTGDPDAAEPLYIEMLAVRRRMLGDDHSETLSHISHLGDLYTDQGRYDEAERLQREALERSVRVLGATHPYALQALDGLIRVLIAAGRVETARPFTQRMLAARRELAEGARANPDAWNAFAWALLTCEPEDLRDPRRGLELAVAANRESGFSDVRYLKTLARGYYASGDTALAIRTQRQAIERLPDHASKLFDELTSALTEFNQRAAGPAEPDVEVSRP
jgi:tetratricopeptide (TPR) repeat protein